MAGPWLRSPFALFFLLPLRAFCAFIGMGLVFFARWRFLACYVPLGSTAGLLASFLLSLGAPLLVAKFLAGAKLD